MSGGSTLRLGGQCGHLAGADHQVVSDDLVLVLEEAALGWAGGARSVGVVGAAVARAQKELRLREPADRAAEVSAVDREDLECIAGDAADPAGNFSGLAVPGGCDGIAEVDQAGLALGKVGERAQVDPGVLARAFLQRRAQQIADERHREHCADRAVQQQRELEEEDAARVAGAARRSRALFGVAVIGFVVSCSFGVIARCSCKASWMRRIGLAGIGGALRGEPGDDVGDLLVGQWLRRVGAPVGHALSGWPAMMMLRRFWSLMSAR